MTEDKSHHLIQLRVRLQRSKGTLKRSCQIADCEEDQLIILERRLALEEDRWLRLAKQ